MIRNIVLFALVGAAFCLDEVVQQVETTRTGHQSIPTLTQTAFGPVAGYAASPVSVTTTSQTKTQTPNGVPIGVGAPLVASNGVVLGNNLVASNGVVLGNNLMSSPLISSNGVILGNNLLSSRLVSNNGLLLGHNNLVASAPLLNPYGYGYNHGYGYGHAAPLLAANGLYSSPYLNSYASPLIHSAPLVSSPIVHSASIVAPSVYGYGLNSPYLSAYNNYMLLKKKK